MPRKPYWPPIVINNAALDLLHLEPFMLTCPVPKREKPLRVDVRFSNHCFTEKFDPNLHGDATILHDADNNPRIFDALRYDLSKGLPGLIGQLPGMKVHQSPDRHNYVFAVTVETIQEGWYEVYFKLRRAHNEKDDYGPRDLNLVVQSAYPVIEKSPMPRRPHTVRFAVLAWTIFLGKQVRLAPR